MLYITNGPATKVVKEDPVKVVEEVEKNIINELVEEINVVNQTIMNEVVEDITEVKQKTGYFASIFGNLFTKRNV